MLDFKIQIPIVKLQNFYNGIDLFMKREDLIDEGISGNKFWKLYYNVQQYFALENFKKTMLITFGGAYSNHISAVAALGNRKKIPTLGIIRGEELEENWQKNPTLLRCYAQGMRFIFVSRETYKNKDEIISEMKIKYPHALILPEGGTNSLAIEGIKWMLDDRVKDFDYLCTAVGTGGTLAGISKYAEENQKVIGYKVVKEDLDRVVRGFSLRDNFEIREASFRGYGKVTSSLIDFINEFYRIYKIPLEPCYTGKMMYQILEDMKNHFFEPKARILVFHTGGLQGVEGFNLSKQAQKTGKIIF